MCRVGRDCRLGGQVRPPEKGPLSRHLEERRAQVADCLGERVPAEPVSPVCLQTLRSGREASVAIQKG